MCRHLPRTSTAATSKAPSDSAVPPAPLTVAALLTVEEIRAWWSGDNDNWSDEMK